MTSSWETVATDNGGTIYTTGIEERKDVVQAKLMTIAAQIISGVDVTELYSPERVVQVARNMGLKGGLSFDLTNGWDFNLQTDRDAAWNYIVTNRPLMVIGSPMCTLFSQLQNLRKISPEGDANFEVRLENAIMHLKFCIKVYRRQSSEGMYYLHEHPATATSWQVQEMQELAQSPDSILVNK